jgi:hypothetical protein
MNRKSSFMATSSFASSAAFSLSPKSFVINADGMEMLCKSCDPAGS